MNIVLRTPRMTREEFFAWAEAREEKYEFDGFEPVAMTRPNVNHATIVGNLLAALRSRLRGGFPRAYTDAGIATVGDAVRYPDTVVSCTRGSGTSYLIENPVAVFEVISPGNSATDRIIKVREYLAVPSIETYVIVEQTTIGLMVLQRQGQTTWTTTTLVSGDKLEWRELSVSIPVDELYEEVEFPAAATG